MNIRPNSTVADAAGVFALAAFLVDPQACVERLKELQAEAKVAYDARSEAQALKNAQVDAVAALETLKAEALAVQAAAVMAKEVVEKQLGDMDVRNTALDVRETSVKVAEQRMTEMVVQQGARDVALDVREMFIADAEAVVAALKAEYEDKLARLSAIVAPKG